MVIKVVDEVDADLVVEAWHLYDRAFRGLNAMTVQRHLMYPEEFADAMGDRRIEKYLAYDATDRLVGMSTYTNVLEAMPLISPEYFTRRWPRLRAAGKIWYCGFVAVAGRNPGTFVELVTAMYRHAEEHGGVIGLDICQFNIEAYQLDEAVWTMLRRVSGGQVHCELADIQTFHIFETVPVGGTVPA